MNRNVTFVATQLTIDWDIEANLDKCEAIIHEAAANGAQVVLLQELFEAPHFCKTQQYKYLDLARPLPENPLVARFAKLAAELEVVLPLSYFERSENTLFNSLPW